MLSTINTANKQASHKLVHAEEERVGPGRKVSQRAGAGKALYFVVLPGVVKASRSKFPSINRH